MRRAALNVLAMLVALTACSETSAPTGDLAAAPTEALAASRKSIHQITAIDLEFPGDGQAYDINNRGEIVGEADVFGEWRKGEFRPLPLPPEWDNMSGEAVNSSGAIVGSSVREGQQGHAVLWKNGVLHDLGVIPGDVNSDAHAINASGDIVGVSTATGGDLFAHAVLWHKGQLIPLGTLPGDLASEAFGIDNAGRVVGESRPQGSPSTWRPFVWDHGVMTELTELEQPGVGFNYIRSGIVAYKCPDEAGVAKANLTRSVGVITYIPCPTESPDEVFPDIEDVNSSGQAVGTVLRRVDLDHFESHGYLWSGGERILLPPVASQPDVGSEPHAINNRGEIVGHTSVGATLWTIR